MPKIEQIHFCAGLGQDAGKPLRPHELVAIQCAAAHHPTAELFLHTALGSCDNYSEATQRLRRQQYPVSAYSKWRTWSIEHGAHMSDRLRLSVLLSAGVQNALYLDTDAFCLQSLDWLAYNEGVAMSRLSPAMLANGAIWVGKDKRFLQEWWNELDKLGQRESYLWCGCGLPDYLHRTGTPGLAVLDATFNGVCGDEAMRGYWAEQSTDLTALTGKPTAHVMGISSIKDGSAVQDRAAYLVQQLAKQRGA